MRRRDFLKMIGGSAATWPLAARAQQAGQPRRIGSRRNFITLLGGAAAWPIAGRAQQPAMPVIGYLAFQSAQDAPALVPFRQGLAELGFVEGQNLAVEYRWVEGQRNRAAAFAAELVQRQV